MSTILNNLFEEFQKNFLKTRINTNMSEHDRQAILDECEAKYSLENWLPIAAKKAIKVAVSSHPSKFSHPDSKTSPVIAQVPYRADGYVRSGNVNTGLLDMLCASAAYLPLAKFLQTVLEDGQNVLAHIQQGTPTIRELFTIPTATYEELVDGFLKVDQTTMTSRLVKQVFFPVDNGYHLLSILTSSSTLYELKERVRATLFSKETNQAKEDKKNGLFNQEGYNDLYDLTVIGFGGSQAQNISMLNAKYHGEAYLLPSIPPKLKNRYVHLPKYDFFKESLWVTNYEKAFLAFHKILDTDRNNIDIRIGRDRCILNTLDRIVTKTYQIRDQQAGWSDTTPYRHLPTHHKIWLDNKYQTERGEQEDWLQEVIAEYAQWYLLSYAKVLGDKTFVFGEDELRHIRKLINTHLYIHYKEAFR